MYNVYIDGELWGSYGHIKYAKQKADELEESLNWYHCEIKRYKKHYAFRFYNSKWSR